MLSFALAGRCGTARRGRLELHRGKVETPAFMPVGTLGTVKAMTPEDISLMGYEMLLCNAFHLWLRPGDQLIAHLDQLLICSFEPAVTGLHVSAGRRDVLVDNCQLVSSVHHGFISPYHSVIVAPEVDTLYSGVRYPRFLAPTILRFTIPSSCLTVAPVGQTSRQDGSSHCMHSTGSACRTTLG